MGRADRTSVSGAALLLVPGIVLALGAWVLLGPPTRLAFLFYDDAYYYFTVARNLAEGAGSTFDGIHPTNGYHPLWCALLVPLLAAVRDPDLGLRAIGALWFLLAAAAPLAVAWAVRPRAGTWGAVLAAALFGLHPFLGLALSRPSGLETPLYALVIALAIGAFERLRGRHARASVVRFLAFGLLCGLVGLARLDGAFLAVAAAGLLLLPAEDRLPLRARLPRAVAVGLGAAALVLPWLLWNQSRFGSPVPVSGRVVALASEAERAELGGALSPGNLKRRAGYAGLRIPGALGHAALGDIPGTRPLRRGHGAAAIALLLGLGVVAVSLSRRRRDHSLAGDSVALLAAFSFLHYAAYALWLWSGGEERYRLYYFLPQALLVASAAGMLLAPRRDGEPRRRDPWIALGAVVLLSIHLAGAVRDRDRGLDRTDVPVSRALVYGWIRERIPEEAVLGARDAGKLGWFSGRRVVNLDGLINDGRFVEVLREGREAEYLRDSPIRFLLYDGDWLPAFDLDDPLGPEDGAAGILRRLHRMPGISVRRVPHPPGSWAVFEIVRDR